MTVGLASSLRTTRITAVKSAIDANASPGQILIYSGTRPATGAAITAQVLLATLTCTKPCGTIASQVLTFDPITAGSGTAGAGTGTTATWARIQDGGGTFVADVSVGTSGAEINLNSTNIVQSASVAITSAAITEGGS